VAVRIGERYRDRYQVLEAIGEGAFARVWRAEDVETHREVALKVLKDPYLGVKEVVERFQREVFAVASIDSPHVVGLFDFGISDDDFYLVTELLKGPSLRHLMAERPWSASDVYLIVGQIAHALKAAHSRSIFHRDLKPENVILVERSSGWQVKVIDFGFAQLPELERSLGLQPLTRKGYVSGTPQYLSPEQIRGKPIDGGADLFALGVITYEMLADKRPWDGDDARDVMMLVLSRVPPAVTKLHETIAPRIEEVNRFLERALSKDRSGRPADAQSFHEELGRALFVGEAPRIESALDKLTSQSISLRIRRSDETETTQVGGSTDRQPTFGGTTTERQAALGDTTVQAPALDSSAIRLNDRTEIPIFVAHEAATHEAAPRLAATLRPESGEPDADRGPRPTATLAPTSIDRSGGLGRALLFILVLAAVAAGAFYLGRTLH
jgi:serine/threonine protein kinase